MLKRNTITFRLTLLVLFLLGSGTAKAQYEHLWMPQDTTELALMQKLHVMGRTEYVVTNGQKQPYRTHAYHESGYVMASIDYFQRRFYKYNNLSQVEAIRDTVLVNEMPEVKDYKFEYDANQRIKRITFPDAVANFAWNAGKNTLRETMKRNDSVFTASYQYTPSGKLHEVTNYNVFGAKIGRVQYNYSNTGLLYNEIRVRYVPEMVDSTYTVYQYNSKKQVSKKFVYVYRSYVFKDGTGKPVNSANHFESDEYEFTYDKQGRKVSESATNSVDKHWQLYRTWKYDDKGLLIQFTTRTGKLAPTVYEYEYHFF